MPETADDELTTQENPIPDFPLVPPWMLLFNKVLGFGAIVVGLFLAPTALWRFVKGNANAGIWVLIGASVLMAGWSLVRRRE